MYMYYGVHMIGTTRLLLETLAIPGLQNVLS